jgi:hypothetical protein
LSTEGRVWRVRVQFFIGLYLYFNGEFNLIFIISKNKKFHIFFLDKQFVTVLCYVLPCFVLQSQLREFYFLFVIKTDKKHFLNFLGRIKTNETITEISVHQKCHFLFIFVSQIKYLKKLKLK